MQRAYADPKNGFPRSTDVYQESGDSYGRAMHRQRPPNLRRVQIPSMDSQVRMAFTSTPVTLVAVRCIGHASQTYDSNILYYEIIFSASACLAIQSTLCPFPWPPVLGIAART